MRYKADTVAIGANYIRCPTCGEGEESGFEFTHFVADGRDTTFGPWHCKTCGRGIRGSYHATDQSVDIEVLDASQDHKPGLMLVRLDPGDKPIHLILDQTIYPGWEDHNYRYLVEEHSCPVNFLRIPIIAGTGTDPHGVLRFVQIIERPEDCDWSGPDPHDTFEDFAKHFPALLDDAENRNV